jgi:hypothetical protein
MFFFPAIAIFVGTIRPRSESKTPHGNLVTTLFIVALPFTVSFPRILIITCGEWADDG